MKYASVLVTGAAGMVGAAVSRRLAAAGTTVLGTDLRDPGDHAGPFIAGDLGDPALVQGVLARHSVEAIIHCGGVSGSMLSIDDPGNIFRTNVAGTFNVLEAMRKTGLRRLVFCSSASVYGGTPAEPVIEESALHPISVYGASKIAGEALMEAYCRMWGLEAVALRIFQVYGPGRTTECQLKSLLTGALQGRPVDIRFAPETRRQYVYIDDVVDAVFNALESPPFPRRTYNICGDASLRLDEIATQVAEAVGRVDVRYQPAPNSPRNARRTVEIIAATRDLGFTPRVALREGLRKYAEWLRPRLATGA